MALTFSEWMYFDAFPVSYFLTISVSSPGRSGGEMGVYGRMIGFPWSLTSALGSDDFTTRQEATGSSDASLLGSSNTNLHYRD